MLIPFVERIREVFDYGPETGVLTRKKATGSRSRLGPCQGLGKVGYYVAALDGTLYYVHRLIWAHQTGEWPDVIDHKDRDKTNNRWSNLRSVTDSANKHNWPMQNNNTSGVAGVWLHKQSGKWAAEIKVSGKKRYLGLFADINSAAAARAAAKRAMHVPVV